MRPAIWLADVLHALRDLAPDEEAQYELLGCLSIPGRAEREPTVMPTDSDQEESILKPLAKDPGGPFPATINPNAASPTDTSVLVFSRLEQESSQTSSSSDPPWWFTSGQYEPMSPAFVSPPRPPRPPRPLFTALHRRSILSYAIAAHAAEGDLDLATVLRILGEGRPLTQLPRLSRRTLRYGVQVLVDRSPWIEPFFPEQDHVLDYLQELFPTDRFQVGYFAACPTRGVYYTGNDSPKPWTAPTPKSCVLLLSDCGIGYRMCRELPPSMKEWAAFSHIVRRAGLFLVAFVPYAPDRWPAVLPRLFQMMAWSERTTANQAYRLQRAREEKT